MTTMRALALVALSAFGLILLVGSGCSRDIDTASSTTARVKGSDTMVHLVTAWAEAFMAENDDLYVSVDAGGSGAGIAALINGTIDIASASREMKQEEKQQASDKGPDPVEFVVARDGIAVVVHPDNPVNELTIEQLSKIYTGAITNWSAVGGNDRKVSILSRESSSGTYAFFREHVMGDQDYTTDAKLMPATSAIIEATAEDRGSIGYVGLGYVAEAGGRAKALEVKVDESSDAVAPSEEAVKSGEYGIARPLYLYSAGEPTGAAKAFIDFALSEAGQAIVSENGYVTAE